MRDVVRLAQAPAADAAHDSLALGIGERIGHIGGNESRRHGVGRDVAARKLPGERRLHEFQDKAKLTLVSATSIVEGGAHDVLLKDKAPYASNTR